MDYCNGVLGFINFATSIPINFSGGGIRCLYRKCKNKMFLHPGAVTMHLCCDVAVTKINYPSFKYNTEDNIEQARGRSHEEGSSQTFMLDDMQLGGVLDVI